MSAGPVIQSQRIDIVVASLQRAWARPSSLELSCLTVSGVYARVSVSHDILLVYTWFPEGKVVFVAPTKPLVAQQIDACHKTCGIPGSHAAELTGQNNRNVRAKAVRSELLAFISFTHVEFSGKKSASST